MNKRAATLGSADGGGGRCAVRRGMRRRQRQQLGHDRSGMAERARVASGERSQHDRRRAGLGHAAGQRLELLTRVPARGRVGVQRAPIRGAQITYGGGGSGKGRTDLTEKTVDYAGSDSPFKDDEKPADPILYFPILLGPITVSFNVSGVDTLNLSPDTIAGIFQREITKWNDPEIAADNRRRRSPRHRRSPSCTAPTARAPRRTSPSGLRWPRPTCGR